MAFEASSARLFGLDLTRAASAFRMGVEGVLRWPAMAWLSRPDAVVVQRADGVSLTCKGGSFEAADSQATPFRALVLPTEIVLFQSFRLPCLTNDQIAEAMELQLQTISPLPLEQIVWGWRLDQVMNDSFYVTLAFAPRGHVDAYLASRLGSAHEKEGEVWVDAGGPVVLRGFGEVRRERSEGRRRRRLFALTLLGVCLFMLVPVAHFWQLRARVFDAQAQFAALEARAAPLAAQRNALVQANNNALKVLAFSEALPDAPRLLETLSELLPDHTWLTRLDIEGQRVRISGQSGGAAALMESLRARPEFTNLRALTPIARTRSDTDTFTFEFMLVERAPQ